MKTRATNGPATESNPGRLSIVQENLSKLGVVIRTDPGQEKVDLMTQHIGHVISQTELLSLKMWDED